MLTITSLAMLFIATADAWSERQRNSDGRIESSKEKFPGGMKALGDYIHSKGESSAGVEEKRVWSTTSAATAIVSAVLLEMCPTGIIWSAYTDTAVLLECHLRLHSSPPAEASLLAWCQLHPDPTSCLNKLQALAFFVL